MVVAARVTFKQADGGCNFLSCSQVDGLSATGTKGTILSAVRQTTTAPQVHQAVPVGAQPLGTAEDEPIQWTMLVNGSHWSGHFGLACSGARVSEMLKPRTLTRC